MNNIEHSPAGVYKPADLVGEDFEDFTLEDILTLVVSRIVEHPEEVEINVVNTQKIKVIEFSVHADDFGLVLGRGGSIIQSLRTIAKAILGASGKHLSYHVSLAGDNRD